MICARHDTRYADGSTGAMLWIFCPGCQTAHAVPVTGLRGWKWNGSLEKPTLEPSLLVRWGEGRRCHSFIREGRMQFLGDSTHELAGKTVDIPELPEWLA